MEDYAPKVARQAFAQGGTVSFTLEEGATVRIHGVVFTNESTNTSNVVVFTVTDNDGNIKHKCLVRGLTSSVLDAPHIANNGWNVSVLDNAVANFANVTVYYSQLGG